MKFSYQYGPQHAPQLLVQSEDGNILLSIVDNQTMQVIESSRSLSVLAIGKMATAAARWNRHQIAEENKAFGNPHHGH